MQSVAHRGPKPEWADLEDPVFAGSQDDCWECVIFIGRGLEAHAGKVNGLSAIVVELHPKWRSLCRWNLAELDGVAIRLIGGLPRPKLRSEQRVAVA